MNFILTIGIITTIKDMNILLFIYAVVALGGMLAGIEDKSAGFLYILAVLLWPLTLVGILIMLFLEWIGVV